MAMDISELELIGKGAFAEVWHRKGADTVLKVGHSNFIHHEAAVLHQLQLQLSGGNPHIINFRGVVCLPHPQDGSPSKALVLAFCDAGSWTTCMPQSLAEAGQTMLHVLRAMQFMHICKLIHCDVKPDSVLLNKEGVAVLAEMNSATDFKDVSTKQRCATVCYSAPEFAAGRSFDQSIDIHSSGHCFLDALQGPPQKSLLVSLFSTPSLSLDLPMQKEYIGALMRDEPALRPSASEAINWLESRQTG